MRFNIAYDAHGRLRVRLGDYAFSEEKAYGIEEFLSGKKGIISVKANHTSGSILISYENGYREKILKLLKNTDLKEIDDGTIPETAVSDKKFYNNLIKAFSGRILTKLLLPIPVRNVLTVIKSVKYIVKGLDSLLAFNMNVSVLDAASIGVSVVTGNFATASSVMFLLGVSELLEDYTRERTRLALTEELKLNIDSVWCVNNGVEEKVPFKNINVGDNIIVYAGSVVPFDGTVCDGEAMVNQASFTGESESVRKANGDSVFAGTTLEAGRIVVTVTSSVENSRLSSIIELIDKSESLKAGVQSKAEKLADGIVPYSFLGFILTWLLTRNSQRAISVLMVDYSCAIKLSTPISVISAMREAAMNGALVKGGKYLESFAESDSIVFDKTGTLTHASPYVTDIVTFNGYERDYVLKTAACLEEHFPHSVANAVVKKALEENLTHEEEHAEVEYLVAHGIATKLYGERAVIGSYHFIFEDEGVKITDEQKKIIEEKSVGNSSIFLALGGVLAGMLVIEDPVREEAHEVMELLRMSGITHICMLTGDSKSAARRAAEKLSLDEYVSEVLPETKSEYIKNLCAKGRKVIMVGDGINDAPALAAANVSAAMSKGSDIARESADITLTNDSLYDLYTLRVLSKKLLERINKNYNFILSFNSALIILGALGVLTPSTSALLHNTSTMLISAFSMTGLLEKNEDN